MTGKVIQVLVMSVVIFVLAIVLIIAGHIRSIMSSSPPTMIFRDHWTDNGNSYTLDYEPQPRQLDKSNIELDVVDKNSTAVSGYTVTADLTMPSMSMPRNIVTLEDLYPGSYTGELRYTMAGKWILKVKLMKSGRVFSTRTLPITVH